MSALIGVVGDDARVAMPSGCRSREDVPGIAVGVMEEEGMDDCSVCSRGNVLACTAGPAGRVPSADEVLDLYLQHGTEFPLRLRGAFAAVVWDASSGTLVLARDRFGGAAMFFSLVDGGVVFSSSLRALRYLGVRREMDPGAVELFLALSFVPAPWTILKGVQKVPASGRVVWKDGAVSRGTWLVLPQIDEGIGLREAVGRVREVFASSVERWCHADTAVWLSGGVDSGAVAALINDRWPGPVRTFSLGFEEPSYDERNYAELISLRLGSKHTEEVLRTMRPAEVRRMVDAMDEPVSDLGFPSTFMLAGLCAREGVAEVASGEGGDELFGGYDAYRAQRLSRYVPASLVGWACRLPPSPAKRGIFNTLRAFARGLALPADLAHVRWRFALDGYGLQLLFGKETFSDVVREYIHSVGYPRSIRDMMLEDVRTELAEAMLPKGRCSAAAHGLKVVFPFQDEEVWEVAMGLPDRLRMGWFSSKRVLKAAIQDLLPPPVLRRRKEGFSAPVKLWLKGSLAGFAEDVLRRLVDEGVVAGGASRLLEEHLRGIANHSHLLWGLVVLSLWMEGEW